MNVPRVPTFILGWVRTSNHLSRVQKEYIDHNKDDRGLGSPKYEYTYFFLRIYLFFMKLI